MSNRMNLKCVKLIAKSRKLIAIAIVFTIAFTFSIPSFAAGTSRAARISDFTGTVTVTKAGGEKSFKAFKGMSLSQGDSIVTGKGSSATLEIDDDKEVTLDENTRMNVSELSASEDEGSQKTGLGLWLGKIFTNIKKKLNVRSKFEVKTPTTVMGVRGTIFTVSQDAEGNTGVVVLTGTVNAVAFKVELKAGQTPQTNEINVTLDANQQTTIAAAAAAQAGVKVEEVTQEQLDLFVLKQIKENPEGVDPALLQNIDKVIDEKEKEKAKQDEESKQNDNNGESGDGQSSSSTQTQQEVTVSYDSTVTTPQQPEQKQEQKQEQEQTQGTQPETPQDIAVSSITVTGADNSTCVERGKTLQMHATVMPENATDRSVVWSVYNSSGDEATISVNGLLTALDAGSVTVTATNTASGVSGSKEITITPSSGDSIVATQFGTIADLNIVEIPDNTKVSDFKDHLSLSPYAIAEIMDMRINAPVPDPSNTYMSPAMAIKVTAENGSIAMYRIYDKAIYSLEDLNDISAIGQTHPYYTYILMRDLDFNQNDSYAGTNAEQDKTTWTSTGWTPIKYTFHEGTEYPSGFCGVFDGGGHTISNLHINSAGDQLGLFAYIVYYNGHRNNGIVMNLKLSDVDIVGSASTSQSSIGTITGAMYEGGYILNCSVTGNISCPKGISIGGITGYSASGTIVGCSANVNISGQSEIGGISGHNGTNGRSWVLVQDCYSVGDIIGSGNYIGGIMGLAYTASIANSYSTGNISGANYVGGLAGRWGDSSSSSSLLDSFALNASVSAGSSGIAGRITGIKYSGGNISANCSTISTMTITRYSSGYDGTNTITPDTAKSISTYSANCWSMDEINSNTSSIWVIDNENSYPALRGQNLQMNSIINGININIYDLWMVPQ